jgi:hypothetical protein
MKYDATGLVRWSNYTSQVNPEGKVTKGGGTELRTEPVGGGNCYPNLVLSIR